MNFSINYATLQKNEIYRFVLESSIFTLSLEIDIIYKHNHII